MSLMIAEVYDALVAAGSPDDKARKAAEALANYDSRFSRIEADMVILKWMTGTILVGILALIMKSFFLLAS